MSNLNEIVINISNIQTGEIYHSRSYPDDDFDNNGMIEYYETPVYKVYIDGIGAQQTKTWRALRFMPYWNDPQSPSHKYKTKGWANAGLVNDIPKKLVTYYNPSYGTQNRSSPFTGAIQIRNNFLIHAGPLNLSNSGWGAAGCVEIIGNFDDFKNDIKQLSGSLHTDAHDAILELVQAQKLYVKVDLALPPNFKNNFWGEL